MMEVKLARTSTYRNAVRVCMCVRVYLVVEMGACVRVFTHPGFVIMETIFCTHTHIV